MLDRAIIEMNTETYTWFGDRTTEKGDMDEAMPCQFDAHGRAEAVELHLMLHNLENLLGLSNHRRRILLGCTDDLGLFYNLLSWVGGSGASRTHRPLSNV